MSVKCGNDRTLALVGAGAATEKVNAKFGDDMDPDVIVKAVDNFLKSGTDVRCRDCGWVKEGKCTLRGHNIDPVQCCNDFRHEYLILDEDINKGIILT